MSDVVASSKLCDVRAGFGTAAASMIGMLPAYVSPRPEDFNPCLVFPLDAWEGGKGVLLSTNAGEFKERISAHAVQDAQGQPVVQHDGAIQMRTGTSHVRRWPSVPPNLRLTSAHAHFGGAPYVA